MAFNSNTTLGGTGSPTINMGNGGTTGNGLSTTELAVDASGYTSRNDLATPYTEPQGGGGIDTSEEEKPLTESTTQVGVVVDVATNNKKSHLYDMPFDSADAGIDVLIQTRPIKFDSDNLKGSFRVVLRGLFIGTPNKYSGIYVSGSIDGKKWMYLGGTERKHIEGVPVRDIGTTIERNSCRFLMITYVGNLRRESKIEYFDVTTSDRYTEKPR